jgi:hypothetical protein
MRKQVLLASHSAAFFSAFTVVFRIALMIEKQISPGKAKNS